MKNNGEKGGDAQCKWPTCQSEEYQNELAAEIHRQLYSGEDKLEPAAPVSAGQASKNRIKYLEGLVKAYGPKSLQYDIEHPNDGLNIAGQAERLDEAVMTLLTEHTKLNGDGIDSYAPRIAAMLNHVALHPVPVDELESDSAGQAVQVSPVGVAVPEPIIGATAWFHRGMVNFDAEDILAQRDDGNGTPIKLYLGPAVALPQGEPERSDTPAGDAHEVIYQIQQKDTEGWSPMSEARIPEFLANGWKVRVAHVRYERIDGDKQGTQGDAS